MVPFASFKKEIFIRSELDALEFILQDLVFKKTKEIIEISHAEKCWKELNETNGNISYASYGFDIRRV